jgi:hypothetical protein
MRRVAVWKAYVLRSPGGVPQANASQRKADTETFAGHRRPQIRPCRALIASRENQAQCSDGAATASENTAYANGSPQARRP